MNTPRLGRIRSALTGMLIALVIVGLLVLAGWSLNLI